MEYSQNMNSTPIEIEEAIDQTYEELEKIGEGGFGVVYRGRHKLTKEYHAIKIQDSKKCKRREVEMLHKYKHDSILPLIFSFITKSQMYMINPLYESNLSYILKTQMNIGIERKIKYFQSILNGVYFLHSNNVMHLDIKPANILVTKDGECILADFGLTKEINIGLITQSTRCLTERYASPERKNNVPSDFADDVWSLGCVLYEIFENGENIDTQYIRGKTTWVQDGAKFYDDIFQNTFKERNKRITLENMMRKFKEISIVILNDIPNLEQREITSNYLAEQPEPQPNFGRLFPIEEGKFEEGITEKTQNAVPKLDMKEENPLSSQEFKPKIQELSECYSNSHPEGVFSNDQENPTIVTQVKSLEFQKEGGKVPIQKVQPEAQTKLTALCLKLKQKKHWIVLIILVSVIFSMLAALLISIFIMKKENSNLQNKISDLENINQRMKLDYDNLSKNYNIQRDELEETRGELKETQSRLSRFNESNKALKDQLRSMKDIEHNVQEELDYYQKLAQNELLIQYEKEKKYLKFQVAKAYDELYFLRKERDRQIINYKRIDLKYIKLKRINQCNDPNYLKIGEGKIWPITKSMTLKNPVVDVLGRNRGTINSLNSLNYYIAAPCRQFDCPNPSATMLFNLNDLNQQPTLIEEYDTNSLASECFFIHDYAAICCEVTGLLQKYEFDSKMNLQPLPLSLYKIPPWAFANITTNALSSCLQMEEGLMVIGDTSGKIYVFDDAGYILTTNITTYPITQLAEVLRGVIMTSNMGGGGVIYDLRDINTPNYSITSSSYSRWHMNNAIISLVGGGEGYFAIAGLYHWNDCPSLNMSCPIISGTIAIGQLFSDLSMNIIKSTDLTDYPGGKNCEFVTIHEIEPGTIFVGGVDACTEVCSWNYIDDPKPKCYSENEDIYNFISFCAI